MRINLRRLFCLSALVTASSFSMSGFSQAQNLGTGSDNSTKVQRRQIQEGLASGQLTKSEAHVLMKQEQKIRRAARSAASDGKWTKKEKLRVEALKAKTSANIYFQSNDKQKSAPRANYQVRQVNQQIRIEDGVKSGQLSTREALTLRRREATLRKNVASAKQDGKVTKKEARQIQRQQDRISDEIYKRRQDALTKKQTPATISTPPLVAKKLPLVESMGQPEQQPDQYQQPVEQQTAQPSRSQFVETNPYSYSDSGGGGGAE
jgi:hypothetical protein